MKNKLTILLGQGKLVECEQGFDVLELFVEPMFELVGREKVCRVRVTARIFIEEFSWRAGSIFIDNHGTQWMSRGGGTFVSVGNKQKYFDLDINDMQLLYEAYHEGA